MKYLVEALRRTLPPDGYFTGMVCIEPMREVVVDGVDDLTYTEYCRDEDAQFWCVFVGTKVKGSPESHYLPIEDFNEREDAEKFCAEVYAYIKANFDTEGADK